MPQCGQKYIKYFPFVFCPDPWPVTLGNGDGQPVNQSPMEINLSETRYYIAIESSVELCNKMLFVSKLSQKEIRKKRKWLAS